MLFRHKTLMTTALAICMAGLLTTSCNDDDSAQGVGGGPAPADINANYTNKLAYGNRANLALTYSGDTLIGKDVTFQTTDARTAELTLNYILPHENATSIKNVALTPDGKGGYTFKGNATSPLNTTFDYSGTITKGRLSLDITGAKVPGTAIGTLSVLPYRINDMDFAMDPEDPTGMRSININHGSAYLSTDNFEAFSLLGGPVTNLLSALLNGVLKDVTFHTDGNITASYSPLPTDFDFKKFSTSVVNNNVEWGTIEWNKSPLNLATYYMTDDTTMYVTPNVDMIIRQIQKDKQSRAITDYADAYKKLNEWTTTGIKLTFKKNPYQKEGQIYKFENIGKYEYRYDGDYLISLDKKEFSAFLPLLESLLTPQLVEEIKEQSGGILDPQALLKNMESSKMLKIGLMLNQQ